MTSPTGSSTPLLKAYGDYMVASEGAGTVQPRVVQRLVEAVADSLRAAVQPTLDRPRMARGIVREYLASLAGSVRTGLDDPLAQASSEAPDPRKADRAAIREAFIEIAEGENGAGVVHVMVGLLDAAFAATPWASSEAEGLNVERLVEAMNDAFWPDDLPFVDDVEGFWRPFAEKVVARLRESRLDWYDTDARLAEVAASLRAESRHDK